MRLAIADCSAIYNGRGNSTLPRGVRAIMVKNDGSVSIHNEKGNKPLNYMKGATFTEGVNLEGEKTWNFESKDEALEIVIYALNMSTEMPLIENDPGTEMDGTEKHLQEWLFNHPEELGEGYRIHSREFSVGRGTADLLAIDPEGNPVAVEIKRMAMLGAVDQCKRYVSSLKKPKNPLDNPDPETIDHSLDFSKTTGMLVALEIKPKTLEWAEKQNIKTVIVPKDWREIV